MNLKKEAGAFLCLSGILLLAIFIVGSFFEKDICNLFYKEIKIKSEAWNEIEQKKLSPTTISFAGDIMLDRGVEQMMNKNGLFYPFQKIEQALKESDIVVGNLEGPIAQDPPQFAATSMVFAFSSEAIEALHFSHFNLFSLANNHTSNIGQQALTETKELLEEADIDFVGDPIDCNQDPLLEKDDIVFLAFNKTFPLNCSDNEIVDVVKEARNLNPERLMIVMFHWGNEYQLKSSTSQQELAHLIIDAGADLIIGHHPHVVQEIGEYKEKLIFYSLGNFIFDQYFSEETRQGLVVELEIWPDKLVYYLLPIQSELSQPFLMLEPEKQKFLRELANRSSASLSEKIELGVIETQK